MIRTILEEIAAAEAALETANEQEKEALCERLSQLYDSCRNFTPEQKVLLSRLAKRPKIGQILPALFTDFFEQRGDRQCREDSSILCGSALFDGRPVTVIGHRKGSTIDENIACNFGMPGPEGYRKALRAMQQAEKFGRPVITFIDTPGAYPGMEAEERGQGEAIARNLAKMSALRVPVIAIVTGEGSSGGALAIGVADRIYMLENAYYSVVTPESCASILWKDAKNRDEACKALRLTAQDLMALKVIDGIIPEALGGAQRDPQALYQQLHDVIAKALDELCGVAPDALVEQRYQRYRGI